jgi:hypothetical protein
MKRPLDEPKACVEDAAAGVEAVRSPSLQAELAAARSGEEEGEPIERVAKRLGVQDL